ncbi:MAG: ABC transporter permease [Trueperaceae bacterium]|nr:ABC transporter permease [Trueperaceae bacterium]
MSAPATEVSRRVGRRGFRRLLSKVPPAILICWALLAVMVLLAIFAPAIAPHDIRAQSLLNRLRPPAFMGGSPDYWLGTDQLGRDVLSRALFALRTTLGIAAIGTVIGMLLGVTLGVLSGMFGGWFDDVVMFLVDVQMSLPFVLVALTVIALLDTSLLVLILVVGIAGWEIHARVVRGQVLAVKELPFVEATQALGARHWRVAVRHVLPNVVSPIIVLTTVNFSYVVLLESALSFLGLGVQPPNTSLGAMLGAGRDYMMSNWTLPAIPGLVIVAITMVVSLIGDWLRDVLDPRQRD